MSGRCLTDLLGIRFKRHGRDKNGFDCFGLAAEVLSRVGIILNDSWSGAINDFEKLESEKENCIVLMERKSMPHVAVYIGDGMIIHTREDTGVIIEPISHYKAKIKGFFYVNNQHI